MLSLRSEGKVYILELNKSLRIVEREGDLGGELLLGLDERGDLCSSLLHLTKVLKSVEKITEGGVVETAGDLLTVS